MSAADAPGREPLVSKIVRAFVTGPLSPLLLLVSIAAGVIAVTATPREEEPQIVVPTADVLVSFPGANAEEVEKLVAAPLERLLWQIDGVEHVYSMSRRDGAIVTVRFFVGEDRERALVRLQSKIDAHRDQAPPGVAGWVVRPVEIDDVPIVALTLRSDRGDAYELRRVAEEMAARLGEVADLSRVEVIGGTAREVRVELDPEAVAAHGLSPLELAGAIHAADAAVTAGAFDRGDVRTMVTAGPSVGTSREAGDLVVGAWEGRPVRLRDVAHLSDGPEEVRAHVRIGFGPGAEGGAEESVPAVTIAVSKKKGTNAVHVAERVLERAGELVPAVLPHGVRMTVTRDYGETANEKVDELLTHLALAIITVVALIAWSLGWREGLIVAAAVPITFALTLLVNLLAGYTINRVTLFALVLVLGLVCDDPIVDVENIHRHFAKRTRPLLESVLFAVNEVRPPVIVATLAVMLSFLPMLFITGMMGPYMRPMAINVPVAMFMSLLVAFTLTPWMSYLLLRSEYGRDAGHGEGKPGVLMRTYRGVVEFFLDRRWARWALTGGLALGLGGAGLLALGGGVPLKMLPYDNKSELLVVVDLPEGSTLEATDAAVADLERSLARENEVRDLESYVGVAGPVDFNGLVRHYNLRREAHQAEIRVNLLPKNRRAQRSHEIALRLRRGLEETAARHGALVKIVETPPGPPVLSTLVAEVRGTPETPYGELVAAGADLRARLAKEPGVVDVDTYAEDAHERLDFALDKQKASLHGVTTADVARTLRLALAGEAAATVHEPSERQPLLLRVVLSRARRSGAEELGRISVKGAAGDLVPLAELGEFRRTTEDQPVWHKDLERVVFVVGEVAGRPPADVVFAMEDSAGKDPLPAGARADWSGEGEWKITVDVFRDLGIAFAAALLGIYVLLVAETRSFKAPALVMLAIPLGLVGVMPGFWLLNRVTGLQVDGWASPVWFTATAMIGLIALAGIVVRNSIILVDFVRHRVADGVPLREAVIESGEKRFRPIVLTAGAAMLGAWPITLDPIFSGLAWSLVFGVLASTAFTLVVIPVAYFAMERRRAAPRKVQD